MVIHGRKWVEKLWFRVRHDELSSTYSLRGPARCSALGAYVSWCDIRFARLIHAHCDVRVAAFAAVSLGGEQNTKPSCRTGTFAWYVIEEVQVVLGAMWVSFRQLIGLWWKYSINFKLCSRYSFLSYLFQDLRYFDWAWKSIILRHLLTGIVALTSTQAKLKRLTAVLVVNSTGWFGYILWHSLWCKTLLIGLCNV